MLSQRKITITKTNGMVRDDHPQTFSGTSIHGLDDFSLEELEEIQFALNRYVYDNYTMRNHLIQQLQYNIYEGNKTI